ncbi:MAG: response regulator [Candidatus Lindowbacteria bacterium]|nr:response regulator [Candidatus Lindowbacteria bacterium]
MQDKPKILVVEDDVALNLSLAFLVEHIGMQALQAYNGLEALKVIQSDNIDAVISDVKMPVMTGIELLCEIKQLKNSLPVIIMTGCGDGKTMKAAADNGAFAFLEKPVQLIALIATIRAAVDFAERNKISSEA